MNKLLIRTVVLAVAFLVVNAVMDTVTVSGGFFGALGVAVVYGLLSAILGTLLRMLAIPLVMITAGLFEFVVNAALLLIVDWLTDWIEIDGFGSALLAAVLLSVTSVVISLVIALVFPDSLDADA
jgi:putative membrane protein